MDVKYGLKYGARRHEAEILLFFNEYNYCYFLAFVSIMLRYGIVELFCELFTISMLGFKISQLI